MVPKKEMPESFLPATESICQYDFLGGMKSGSAAEWDVVSFWSVSGFKSSWDWLLGAVDSAAMAAFLS